MINDRQKEQTLKLLKSVRITCKAGTHDLRKSKDALIRAVQKALESHKPSSLTKTMDGPFQVFDFFSGAGGMTAGFASVAKVIPCIKILAGIDVNPDAAKTFEKNFHAPGFVLDIKTLLEETALEKFVSKVPEYDPQKPLIVIGCAPCQGFTSHRKKNWEHKDLRNNLLVTFSSVAVQLNPDCIVMENVPEMYSKKYHAYFDRAERILSQHGYIVYKRIYNTASFGVPQERFRMLVMAMKRDFLLPEPILARERFLTVKDAIGKLDKVEAGEMCVTDAYHISAKHKASTLDIIKRIPKDGGNRPRGVGPKCLDRVKGFTDVYGRLSWDKPAITITQYARNPASGRYVHPEQNRGLTIREAALLQSFPKGFQFTGNFDSMFKQIGEAVPPKFACAVAANAIIELLSPAPTTDEKLLQHKYVHEAVNNSYSSVIAGLK